MTFSDEQEIRIHLQGSKLHIRTPYNPDFVQAIKVIRSRRWKVRSKMWSMPRTVFPVLQKVCLQVFGVTIRNEKSMYLVKM